MSASTTTSRRPAKPGTANRADRSAWKDDLRLIQSGLESLARHTQRDHYHHAVLYSAGPLPDAVPRGPRVYASGHRVARRIDVPLPRGGHLAHFIFDHNLDAAEDCVLSGLRRELGRVRSVLRAMPRGLVPEFDAAPLDGSPDGHLVAWCSLLHWLAHRRPNRVFTAHLECLPSSDQMEAGELFSPWDDCPAATDLDPVPFLTGTKPEAAGGVVARSPGVIASSLSKPLLYASVNAIELILGACGDDHPPAPPNRGRAVAGRLDPLSVQLLILLYGHHKLPDESINDEPLAEQRIADELGCSQPTVSRRMARLFGDGPKGTRPMTPYRTLCRDVHRIDTALTRLWFKHMEPKLERQFAVGEMEQFADERDSPDE
jgi:AraC-like DNA-binding protein